MLAHAAGRSSTHASSTQARSRNFGYLRNGINEACRWCLSNAAQARWPDAPVVDLGPLGTCSGYVPALWEVLSAVSAARDAASAGFKVHRRTLGHRGVLFLDECAEFQPHVLDALRTPLEEGEVRLARADGSVRYPARFQLVLAANPCPCAPARDRDCICTSIVRRRYLGRLSGPLLDRVDLRARMVPVTEIGTAGTVEEDTATVRERVLAARAAAAERWSAHGWRTNAEVPGPALRRTFGLPRAVVRPLEERMRAGELSARGADRALRVAWTLADLAGASSPDREAVDNALYYRERGAA
ncbi:ATP-binding protein [Pseudonocardia lutea]|uniref:ATP-binding protein n=1 Tax=Pseudonocardia lutea TaxID=2172015 RepID=A0ABW1IHY9_9PSEU